VVGHQFFGAELSHKHQDSVEVSRKVETCVLQNLLELFFAAYYKLVSEGTLVHCFSVHHNVVAVF
tara:strand:- start:248 stop:442 length:195 start_codon:yes stop_codon:yes gene_type:complete